MNAASLWIENTTSKHDHGGAGWEFGSCIWSPAHDRRGAEGKYRIMRSVRESDRVINCNDGVFCGLSTVATECKTLQEGPPNPGPWAFAKQFYRIDLRDYRELPNPVSIAALTERYTEEIKSDIKLHRPKYFLFALYPESEFHPTGKIVLAQGRFLARATPKLGSLLAKLLDLDESDFG